MSEKIIAICAANFYAEASRDMINSISKECEKKGFSVWVFNAFSDLNFEEINDLAKESIFDLMENTSFSAVVILTPTIQNEETIERIKKKALALHVPVISYEMELEGCYNIIFDYEKAMAEIVEHLITEHDCQRIHMIAGRKDNEFSEQRLDIYKRTMKKHGLPVTEDMVGYGDFWDEPAMKVMQSFIDQCETLPDAVVCANDAMATAACKILVQNGYSVPEDVLITGFDGIDAEKHYFPRLTTALRDYDRAGQSIAEIAKGYYESQINTPQTLITPIQVVFSQSCGCPYVETRNVNDIIGIYQKKSQDRIWEDYVLNNLNIKGERQTNLGDMLSQMEPALERWRFPLYQLFLNKEDIKNKDYFPANVQLPETMKDGQQNRQEQSHIKPEELLLAIHWEDGEFSVPFKQEKDFMDCYRKYPIIVFSPILEKDIVFGYSVVAYPCIDDSNAHCLFKLTVQQGHMLSAYANKERLYRLNQELYEKNAQIEALYIRDPLTKIYNRRGFQQIFYQMLKEKESKYIMLSSLDLDGLKYINDTFGHKDGDFAINSFAEVLTSLCGEDDFCARFGGDEFVFVSFTDDKEISDKFQKRLYDKLEEFQKSIDKPYAITGSCGCYLSPKDAAIDEDVMLQKADAAMYENKKQRKNKV